LPLLNREALLARVEAQKALLGARSLFEDAQGQPLPWLSSVGNEFPDEPTIDDDLLASLPGSSGLGTVADMRSVERVNGNALGLFEPIDGSSTGTAGGEAPLQAFYQALVDLRRGADPDGKVRILMYGASHTDADIYPHYLRTYLQERFGDGGHGFVHIAKPWRWYGHVDMEVEGLSHWVTEHVQRRGAREDGYYGLLGASLATKSKKAFGQITHRRGAVGSTYDLYFLQQPRGGSFRVLVDGLQVATVKTRAAEFGPGYHVVQVPEGEHAIEVHPLGNGEVRMFGMTAERDAPGVVVDTLGIGGTRAANMLEWNEMVWMDNVRRRDPALVVLAYGTNEANDTDQPIEIYEADLRQVVDRVARAAPAASCLLVGPGDFPIATPDGLLPRPRLAQIVEVQARVAADMGCGFWDTFAFMGGALSMEQWANAIPPMAKGDYVHLTRRGYVRMGMALVDALMLDYDGGEVLGL
jgi:lysophospholipase L1-like esterase